MQFELHAPYQPNGDQPEAIHQLTEGLNNGDKHQVLLGVTGSGKTFTIANVIEKVQRPTLVFSHNKTLAAQLYSEFKQFFPKNQVEFFISYYDYYQPEAYLPSSDTYIEKDLAINEEIEKLRLRATAALLSGRRDVIIVASVSCIYGIGRPEEYASHILHMKRGDKFGRNAFLYHLVSLLYARSESEFKQGQFRVKGDTIDIFPAYEENAIRIIFFGQEIERLQYIDPETGKKIAEVEEFSLFPASLFVVSKELLEKSLRVIQDEMMHQIEYFKRGGQFTEATRIKERTEYDLEMMRELGFCKGIENYSRHLTEREPGDRPYCLLDYFPPDFLTVIDESHATIPQIRGMSGGDRSRKLVLVENGFRLPSALDNRPLKFDEFESLIHQAIYVSATPGDYEIEKSDGVVVEQIVRPTGLLDPPVEVRPLASQVDDLLEEISKTVKNGERVLVTTLTKRMSEELAGYVAGLGVKARYLHSGIDALERVEILRDLRLGKFDVLVGINLLREGLDLPEVSLVAIMDADKEGFLRSERAFIQTAGRAARNVNGRVILYADKITESMQKLINETERRRTKQQQYNELHNIVPATVGKTPSEIIGQPSITPNKIIPEQSFIDSAKVAVDPVTANMTVAQLEKLVKETRKKMEIAAKEEDYLTAVKYRDEMFALETLINEKKSES